MSKESGSASSQALRERLGQVLETAEDGEMFSLLLDAIRSAVATDPRLARAALVSPSRSSAALQVLHEIRSFITVIAANLGEMEEQLLLVVSGKPPASIDRVQVVADFRMALQDAQMACDMCMNLARQSQVLASDGPTVSLPKVVELAARMFHRTKNPKISFVVPTRVDEVGLELDPQALIQVLWNLLRNADEATVDLENPRIELRQWATSDSVFIQIRDNGPGLAPGSEERVFELFHTTKAHGGGLGLFLCKSIVDGWGGSLSARSEESGGAVFTVCVPRA